MSETTTALPSIDSDRQARRFKHAAQRFADDTVRLPSVNIDSWRMPNCSRRAFVGTSAKAAIAALGGMGLRSPAASGPAVAAVAPEAVTRRLAQYLVSARRAEIPVNVRKEATRTLLNFMGVAVGGARHESVDFALAATGPFAGPAQAQVLGRRERLDINTATLLNGISSHVLNFDDTHLNTIIHASSPIVPPALALAEHRPATSGADFLHALILGLETAFRVGSAVYPEHFDAGWHITGTTGAIGAAAAAGRLLELNEQQMVWALGLAASQPVGLRESFGSMNKSLNPGRAGQNGLLAALLAARNFTSSDQMLEAKTGWAHTLSTKQNLPAITDGLGVRFETALNTYLPFACGIVIHPAIDGCIRLRHEHGLQPDEVAKVELRVHPRVLQLGGKKTPASGLEGKFSVYHAAAIALIAGRAGPGQFSDEAVRAAATVRLRERVSASVDPAVKETQAGVKLTLRDGRTVETFVAHVVGSAQNPMTDEALTDKVSDLLEASLPPRQVRALIDACWNVEKLPSAATLAQLAAAA
ncbi:MAG: MmgE/PrpD family protein [Opitutaceae bacterium]|nr:MmgE/PrpD family protein [Opitutaceae bacterium]